MSQLCCILLLSIATSAPLAAQVSPSQERLDILLRNWEERTRDMRVLRCEFRRRVRQQAYPDVIEEYGRAIYVRPNKGRMDLWRVKHDENGKQQLVRSEIFVCDGRVIHQYVFDAKEYIRHILPDEKTGEQAARSALPFLFGMTAQEVRERFTLNLYKEDDEHAWIEIRPRTPQDQKEFSVVRVVLSKSNYLPQAVLIVEPIGDQYLYEISKIEINPADGIDEQAVQPLRPPRDWQVYVNRLDENDHAVGNRPPAPKNDQGLRR